MDKRELKLIAKEYLPIFKNAKNITSLKREMKSRGFVYRKSTGVAFLNKKEKIVVKLGFLVEPWLSNKFLIPHFKKHIKDSKKFSWSPIRFGGEGTYFLVQPLADTSEKSIDFARSKLKDLFKDEHTGNIGVWDGKAVAIDW